MHMYSSTVTLPKALNPGENPNVCFVIGEYYESTKSKTQFLLLVASRDPKDSRISSCFHCIQQSALTNHR